MAKTDSFLPQLRPDYAIKDSNRFSSVFLSYKSDQLFFRFNSNFGHSRPIVHLNDLDFSATCTKTSENWPSLINNAPQVTTLVRFVTTLFVTNRPLSRKATSETRTRISSSGPCFCEIRQFMTVMSELSASIHSCSDSNRSSLNCIFSNCPRFRLYWRRLWRNCL